MKNTVTLPLTVTNNEPAGTLTLSTTIRHRNPGDFAVTGGTCKTNNKLGAGSSCTYQVTLTGHKRDVGAVSTDFTITGKFGAKVCPSGDVQSVIVTLAGNITSP